MVIGLANLWYIKFPLQKHTPYKKEKELNIAKVKTRHQQCQVLKEWFFFFFFWQQNNGILLDSFKIWLIGYII